MIITDNKKFREQLIKNADNLVYEHCYKLDGKASLRIAGLVKNILRKYNYYVKTP